MDDVELDRLAARLLEKMEARGQNIAPRMLTVEETARYLGRTVKAIEHMLSKGTLPKTKLDGKVQVDKQLLDLMITAGTI